MRTTRPQHTRRDRTRTGGPLCVHVTTPGDTVRPRLEDFVRDVYEQAYGARVEHFLPLLLGLEGADGDIVGVIGTRLGRTPGPWYLEQYLDAPIEDALAERLPSPAPRRRLAEVGNLSSLAPGGGRWLISTLAAYLDGVGVDWAVFTGTTALRNGFRRLGVEPLDLGSADGRRLGTGLAAWGDYYETAPRVTGTFIPEVRRAVAARPRLADALGGAWQHAFLAGTRDDAARAA